MIYLKKKTKYFFLCVPSQFSELKVREIDGFNVIQDLQEQYYFTQESGEQKETM